jgi:mono/diheme cytochrome c family protein
LERRGLPIVSRGLSSTIAVGLLGALLLAAGCYGAVQAQGTQPVMAGADAARGRALFVRKGCIACHAVNEIGGTTGPPLEVESAPDEIDPLDFVARMWRGAEPMVMMQQSLFGEQLDFTGEELADIIAFAHDPEEQRRFSEADVPPAMRRLIREQ